MVAFLLRQFLLPLAAAAAVGAAGQKPDLNTISAATLQGRIRYYGWPSRLGEQLLLLRDSLGDFEDMRQLALLPGVGKKWATKLAQVFRIVPAATRQPALQEKLAGLRGKKTLSPQNVAVNHAGRERLAALPGLDSGLAGRIIAWRRKFGAFAEPWQLLAVPGITPDRYGLLRRHIHAGPARFCTFYLDNRLQLGKKNAGEMLCRLSIRKTVFLEALYENLFSHTGGGIREEGRLGSWRIGYAGHGALRHFIAGSFSLYPCELETGTLPQNGYTIRPRTFSGKGMISTNTTLASRLMDRQSGCGSVLQLGKVTLEALYSSSTLKAADPLTEYWLPEEKKEAVRLAGLGVLYPGRWGHIQLRNYVKDMCGATVFFQTCALVLRRKNLAWGGAASLFYPAAGAAPAQALLFHFRAHGRRAALAMMCFASAPGFRPLFDDSWGRSILPGRGARLAGSCTPLRTLVFSANWLHTRELPDEKLYQKVSISAAWTPLPSLSLRTTCVHRERGETDAQIWAPAGFHASLRYTPPSGPHAVLEWLGARGGQGTGSALHGSLATRPAAAFATRLWYAAGSPGKGAPLYLQPLPLADWPLGGRACFSDFRALSLSFTLQPCPALELAACGLYFRDRNKQETLFRMSVHLRP